MRKIHSSPGNSMVKGVICYKGMGKKGFSVCVCISKDVLLITCVLVDVDSSSLGNQNRICL